MFIFQFAVLADNDNLTEVFQDLDLANHYKSLNHHNPLMAHKFGADPAGMVHDGRLYVYMTNDIIERDNQGNIVENTYGQITTINRISSADLVNWTDHGEINIGSRGTGKATWAGLSWAPDATYKIIDGEDKFFLYFSNNANSVGVLTSDSPVGPFEDPLGRALISRSTENVGGVEWLFDPGVFIDDDGKGYLYFGGGVPEGQGEMPNTARAVQLGDDMISLAGRPEVVEAPFFFEAAYMNKIEDTYYFSYSTNFASRFGAEGEHRPSAGTIAYMTSESPMGPWEYQDVILQNPGSFFGSGGNNHHSLIKFNDQWYMLYHSQILQDSMDYTGGYRSTHIDKVTIAEDGTIKPIVATRRGVEQVKSLNPYQVNEAETMAWSSGISVKETNEPSENFPLNMVVTDMNDGSYIGVSGVDFGQDGAYSFTAKVACDSDGNAIKIVAGYINDDAIGYLEVPNTGSLDNFEKVSIDLENLSGEHNLFFIFAGEAFYFDAWSFEK
ncbi:glycoside hydrolase family 43 protein [Natronospora cellulosivora (SeqCode)]